MSELKKALILGGRTGLLGQALSEVLQDAGWKVLATDRSMVDFSQSDAREKLDGLITSFAPSCIFNCIGYTQVDGAEDDEDAALLLNRTVPATIARVAKKHDCCFIHYSTDFVFNGKKNTPYSEEDETEPLCVYGTTKLAGEEAILALDLPKFLILRTAWLFGPGKGNFIRTIVTKCADKTSLGVVHDQTGSPTYTIDLAQHTLRLVESGQSGIFNVANSGQASWCELADEAVALARVECTITAVPSTAYPQKATRPTYSVLNTKKLERATGVAPRPWPQALRDYIYREFLSE